jgi:hypothetical protein
MSNVFFIFHSFFSWIKELFLSCCIDYTIELSEIVDNKISELDISEEYSELNAPSSNTNDCSDKIPEQDNDTNIETYFQKEVVDILDIGLLSDNDNDDIISTNDINPPIQNLESSIDSFINEEISQNDVNEIIENVTDEPKSLETVQSESSPEETILDTNLDNTSINDVEKNMEAIIPDESVNETPIIPHEPINDVEKIVEAIINDLPINDNSNMDEILPENNPIVNEESP